MSAAAETQHKTVVALLGSRRKGNTYRLLKQLEAALALQRIELRIHNIHDYDLEDCTGCHRCVLGKRCGLRDDQEALMDAMRGADGIVFAAPVYMDHIPGRLKNVIDRACRWFHRPELVGKPLLCIATTAHSGLVPSLDYLEHVGVRWGMLPAGKIGRSAHDIHVPLSRRELRAFVEHMHMDRARHRPSLEQLFDFQVKRVLARKVFDEDRKFFEARGWLDQPYYYACEIHPLKLAAAKVFHAFLFSRVQRTVSRRDRDGSLERALSPVDLGSSGERPVENDVVRLEALVRRERPRRDAG